MRSSMRQNKKNMAERFKTRSKMIGAAAFWLLLWQFAAIWMDNDILLVGPLQMLAALLQAFREPVFWGSIANSFFRIGSGFLLAAAAGIGLGACACRFSFFRILLSPPVSLMKSIPVASFVILAIIWLGGTKNLSTFVSFVVVFPMVYLNTIGGLLSTDRKLLEMARVFRVGFWKKWQFIYIPALLPYLLTCFRISLGMAWKSGVAAELIGQPAHTIGNSLYQAKIFLDTPALFAWTFTVIAISLLFEKSMIRLLGLVSPAQREAVEGGSKTEIRNREAEQRSDAAGMNAACADAACVNAAGTGVSGTDASRAAACAVRWSGVCKAFGSTKVLSGFSGHMEAPGIYALSGESGSGKTTFFRLLMGLDAPDSGSILWEETDSEGNKITVRPPCAAVFQEDRLCETVSAVENILLCMGQGSADRKRIREELCCVLPQECLDKPVGMLSGGQKRRVALVRAMSAPRAAAIFLDEPFTGLDEETKQAAVRYVSARRNGRLLVISTHEEADRRALSICGDHVIRIGEETGPSIGSI